MSNKPFHVDERLEQDGLFLKDLKLCRVFLKKDADNPWLILVPRKSNLTEIIDLSDSDQLQLMKEMSLCSFILRNEFDSHKLNVGALGNIVPQLHIHIIARFKEDRAWPHPIWGTQALKPWTDSLAKEWSEKIIKGI